MKLFLGLKKLVWSWKLHCDPEIGKNQSEDWTVYTIAEIYAAAYLPNLTSVGHELGRAVCLNILLMI